MANICFQYPPRHLKSLVTIAKFFVIALYQELPLRVLEVCGSEVAEAVLVHYADLLADGHI